MMTSCADSTIDELINDPLTRTLMRADGVDPSELEAMLRSLAHLVVRPAARASGVAQASFDRVAVDRFLRSMDQRPSDAWCAAASANIRVECCGARLPW